MVALAVHKKGMFLDRKIHKMLLINNNIVVHNPQLQHEQPSHVIQYGFHDEYTAQLNLSASLFPDLSPQLRTTFPNPTRYHQILNCQGTINHGDVYEEKYLDTKWQIISRRLCEGLSFLFFFAVFKF